MNLDPTKPPCENLGLSHWKLTLPSGDEVATAKLNAGYTKPGAFFTDPQTGGVVFKSGNLAGHTSGSHYSRCELREMLKPDGDSSDPANNWTTAQGGTLTSRLRVDRVSTTGDADKAGRVVIGQIHGPETEVIRLYYAQRPGEATGRIYAGMDSIKDVTSWSADIVTNKGGAGIALGERFGYIIRLAGRKLTVHVHDRGGMRFVMPAREIDVGYVGLPLYFKAGVYNQNDTGTAEDYAQATFFGLEHSHP